MSEETFVLGAVADRYVVPPFSVLNTMTGNWPRRRHWWLSLGIRSELGRGDADPDADGTVMQNGRTAARAFSKDGMAGEFGFEMGRPRATRRDADRASNVTEAALLPDYAASMQMERVAPGTSIFDPVLCELMYRWFCPPGGTILDPFAGGSVRGIVAGHLGHPYHGIDLRAEQIASNLEQVGTILTDGQPHPTYSVGDSRDVLPTLAAQVDMVFTCPPYFDLEVYSDDPADLSNADTYADFLTAYRQIIHDAAGHLRDGRYMVLVVSEVRDRRSPDGSFVGLVPDTIAAATAAGLRYYNEMILVNSAGTLPLRITKQFEAGRKVGRMHQNVLVFVKGRVSRGWDHQRAAPPDPQLSLFEAPEPTETAAPAEVAPVGAPVVIVALDRGAGDDVTAGPLRRLDPDPEPSVIDEMHVWHVMPDVPPVDVDMVTTAGDAAPGIVRSDDGYPVDVDTGEILRPVREPAITVGPMGWRCVACMTPAMDPLVPDGKDNLARGLCLECDRPRALFIRQRTGP